MPSSKKIITQIVNFAEGETVELGSGWGGLARALSKKGCEVTAFEVSPLPYLTCRLRGIRCRREDFFKVDLSQYDTVVCYLYPGAMRKLKEKFERELSAHATIITNTFAVPGWKATKVIEFNDLYRSKVFIYRLCDVLDAQKLR